MPLTTDGHHEMLWAINGVGLSVGLIEATTLTAELASGSTTVPVASVARTLKVGDYVAFYDGATREEFEIVATDGTNYTLSGTTTTTFPVNSDVGHAPKLGADVVEPTGGAPAYARKTIAWEDPASENLSMDATNKPLFDVNGGKTIGGFAIYRVPNDTCLGTFLTNSIESFGSQGNYQLTDADVNLTS